MQNVTNYGSHDHPNAMIREDDPLYPCNALGKRYQPTCYTYAVLERFQGNLPKGIELCKMIPEDLRVGCFKTLGRNTTMYSDNPESLRSDCAQIKEKEYYEACLYGTGGNLVARYGLESPLPFNFCAGVPEESKAVCYGALGSSALMLLPNAEALAAYCGKMSEGEYNDACVGGS